jgi:hypothetical protein
LRRNKFEARKTVLINNEIPKGPERQEQIKVTTSSSRIQTRIRSVESLGTQVSYGEDLLELCLYLRMNIQGVQHPS